MIGGGSGIFGVLTAEESADLVELLILFGLPGESVDEGSDGVVRDGPASEISVVV